MFTALVAAAVFASAPSRPLLLAHVMPWFEAEPARLGWHWTMGKLDPAEVRRTGRVASHYRPLIGAYDSDDPVVVELQTLWMRVAGFDGVLADWYGTQPHDDYPMIHARTRRLFDAAERVGLKIGVVYEDQTVRNAVRGGLIGPDRAMPIARETGQFLRSWFRRKGWWRVAGQPVVMVFGPQGFGAPEWAAFREGAGDHRLFVLHHPQPFAQGVFDWPVPSQGLAFT